MTASDKSPGLLEAAEEVLLELGWQFRSNSPLGRLQDAVDRAKAEPAGERVGTTDGGALLAWMNENSLRMAEWHECGASDTVHYHEWLIEEIRRRLAFQPEQAQPSPAAEARLSTGRSRLHEELDARFPIYQDFEDFCRRRIAAQPSPAVVVPEDVRAWAKNVAENGENPLRVKAAKILLSLAPQPASEPRQSPADLIDTTQDGPHPASAAATRAKKPDPEPGDEIDEWYVGISDACFKDGRTASESRMIDQGFEIMRRLERTIEKQRQELARDRAESTERLRRAEAAEQRVRELEASGNTPGDMQIANDRVKVLEDEVEELPTVKCRIALVVEDDADWSARGSKGQSDDGMMRDVAEDHGAVRDCYWIDVVVPLPAATTIKATLENTAPGGSGQPQPKD